MNYLIVPLDAQLNVGAGDTIEVSFSYEPGDRLGALAPTARIL